jgi:prophage DNA circulation protein
VVSWKDRLRPASFRGVPFFVDSTTDPVGRTGAVHLYPKRDDAFVEDLGLFNGEIIVRAYLVGPNYMEQRDELLAALNQSGTGILVHPYFGEIEVFCLPGSQNHALRDGGAVFFNLTFFRSGAAARNPRATADTIAEVADSADQTLLAAVLDFEADFSVAAIADWAINDAVGVLDEVAADFRNLANNIPVLPEALALVDHVNRQVQSIVVAGEKLVHAPGAYASRIVSVVESIGHAVDPTERLHFFGGLFNRAVTYGARTVTVATPSAVAADRNAAAVRRLVQQAAVAEAARAITGEVAFRGTKAGQRIDQLLMQAAADPEANSAGSALIVVRGQPEQSVIDPAYVRAVTSGRLSRASVIVLDEDTEAAAPIVFESRDQALTVRDALLTAIDALLPAAGPRAFRSLGGLRAAAAKDIKVRAALLPELVRYTPRATLPSLALAWSLYHDAERYAGIAARNSIAHPGFVPGGRELEVLSA